MTSRRTILTSAAAITAAALCAPLAKAVAGNFGPVNTFGKWTTRILRDGRRFIVRIASFAEGGDVIAIDCWGGRARRLTMISTVSGFENIANAMALDGARADCRLRVDRLTLVRGRCSISFDFGALSSATGFFEFAIRDIAGLLHDMEKGRVLRIRLELLGNEIYSSADLTGFAKAHADAMQRLAEIEGTKESPHEDFFRDEPSPSPAPQKPRKKSPSPQQDEGLLSI